MAIPNATIENTGVKVITAVICKNAAMIPIIKLTIRAMPEQSRLFPQFTIDKKFTSFIHNVCKKVLFVYTQYLRYDVCLFLHFHIRQHFISAFLVDMHCSFVFFFHFQSQNCMRISFIHQLKELRAESLSSILWFEV